MTENHFMNIEILLTIFVGLTALAFLVLAIVAVAALVVARRTIKTMQAHVEELRSVAMPILKRSHEVIDRVSPKVESIAGNLEELSQNVRRQGADIQATTNDILTRVHRQSSRVDALFTRSLDGVEHAGNVVADSVSKPAKQASAILAAARAFLNVMARGRRPERQAEVAADHDMFV